MSHASKPSSSAVFSLSATGILAALGAGGCSGSGENSAVNISGGAATALGGRSAAATTGSDHPQGGTQSSSGVAAAGGVPSSGSTRGGGGAASDPTASSGGLTATGSTTTTLATAGGSTGTSETTGAGGTKASAASGSKGDSKAVGSSAATGGSKATGGVPSAGGRANTGGSSPSSGATGCVSGPIGTITGAFADGVNFLDTDGKRVNAHGGGIIKEGDTYYMHGEYFLSTTTDNDFNGFSMYSSKDLATWKNEGLILPQQASGELGPKRKGERPHIAYLSTWKLDVGKDTWSQWARIRYQVSGKCAGLHQDQRGARSC